MRKKEEIIDYGIGFLVATLVLFIIAPIIFAIVMVRPIEFFVISSEPPILAFTKGVLYIAFALFIVEMLRKRREKKSEK